MKTIDEVLVEIESLREQYTQSLKETGAITDTVSIALLNYLRRFIHEDSGV